MKFFGRRIKAAANDTRAGVRKWCCTALFPSFMRAKSLISRMPRCTETSTSRQNFPGPRHTDLLSVTLQ